MRIFACVCQKETRNWPVWLGSRARWSGRKRPKATSIVTSPTKNLKFRTSQFFRLIYKTSHILRGFE